MMGIRGILTLLLVTLLMSCNDRLEDNRVTYDGPPFVRFYLLLNSDEQPYEPGLVISNKNAVESMMVNGFRPIKIPVVFSSSTPLNDSLYVTFNALSHGSYNGISITPQNRLVFHNSKLTDTITVSFTKRWVEGQNDSITLRLLTASEADVHIGHLNERLKNDELTLHLGEQRTTMQFRKNRIELIGTPGEQVVFNIDFAGGLIKNEIDPLSLFDQMQGFDYTLEAAPFNDGDKSIAYTLTFNDLNVNDFIYLESRFTLLTQSGYIPTGITSFQIIKPVRAIRDNTVNTAARFYNLNDWLNRTYGELWIDYSNTGECNWRSFNTFTYPVVVAANHPDAVLYDDKGTADESDDVYHHAFRIGFNSPNAGRTTNALGLKNWFNNEYTDEDKSPGFNIPEALEFFPENGNSDSTGTVLVIPQNLTISNRSDKQFILAIKGEGTYRKIDQNLFELEFYMDVTNDELFGGTQRGWYKLYNSNIYSEPEPLESGCFTAIDL